MNRLLTCTTCNGEGRIQDRRENNRDEEIGLTEAERDYEEEIKKHNIVSFKGLTSTYSKPKVNSKYLYDCKIPYDDSAKDLIKQLRKSGHKIRVRGSGARAKWSLMETNGLHRRKYKSHIPLKYASHVRLYITK